MCTSIIFCKEEATLCFVLYLKNTRRPVFVTKGENNLLLTEIPDLVFSQMSLIKIHTNVFHDI